MVLNIIEDQKYSAQTQVKYHIKKVDKISKNSQYVL